MYVRHLPVPELDNSLYALENHLVFYYIGIIIMDSHENWDFKKSPPQRKNNNNN